VTGVQTWLFRSQVLACLIGEQVTVQAERRDGYLALAFGILAKVDDAVDFSNDRVIFGTTRLKELSYAGQTTGNVLHLSHVTRHTSEFLTGSNRFVFTSNNVRAYRQ